MQCNEGYEHEWIPIRTGFYCGICSLVVKKKVKVPSSLGRRLLIRGDKDECAYCEADLDDYNRTVDHVHPRSRGGSNRMENLVLCCKACNTDKGDQLLEEWTDRWYNRPMTQRQRAVFEWRFKERLPCPQCKKKMQPTKKGWKCPDSACQHEVHKPGVI